MCENYFGANDSTSEIRSQSVDFTNKTDSSLLLNLPSDKTSYNLSGSVRTVIENGPQQVNETNELNDSFTGEAFFLAACTFLWLWVTV